MLVSAPSRARSFASRLSSADFHQASSSSAATWLSGTWRAARSVIRASSSRSRSPETSLAALLQVVQHVGVGGEAVEQLAEQLQRQRRELRLARVATERTVERLEVLRDLLPGDLHVGDADRHLGGDAGDDEALPEDALLLDAGERLVQVADVHAGAHVLLRELAQAAAVDARHLRGVAARGGRDDELAQRAVEDGGLELVEGVAQLGEQVQVDAELRDRGERPHPGRADELLGAHEQSRQLLGVQALRELVGARGVLAAREARAVPGRVAGAVAELAELRGLDHRRGDLRAVAGELLERGAVESGGRGRRMRQQRQAGELGHAVEDRDPEHRVGPRQRLAVVEQHVAQADEGLVDLGELGLRDALVARDAAHDIPPQAARRDREPRQADVAEALGDAAQRRAASAHHEHALVLPDQAADRVDDRLGAAGAGHRADDERVAGRDLRDDVLLLGVGVEQQDVGGRLAAVRIDRLDRRVALLERPLRGRVAGEGVEHGVLEVLGVGDQRGGDLREGGDHEPRLHLEVEQVAGEGAQLIDDGVGLEGAVALAQRDERLRRRARCRTGSRARRRARG